MLNSEAPVQFVSTGVQKIWSNESLSGVRAYVHELISTELLRGPDIIHEVYCMTLVVEKFAFARHAAQEELRPNRVPDHLARVNPGAHIHNLKGKLLLLRVRCSVLLSKPRPFRSHTVAYQCVSHLPDKVRWVRQARSVLVKYCLLILHN